MLCSTSPLCEGRAQGEKKRSPAPTKLPDNLEVRFSSVGSSKRAGAKAAVLDLSTKDITLLTNCRCVQGTYLVVELYSASGHVLDKTVARVQTEHKGLTPGDWVVQCAFLVALNRSGLPATVTEANT